MRQLFLHLRGDFRDRVMPQGEAHHQENIVAKEGYMTKSLLKSTGPITVMFAQFYEERLNTNTVLKWFITSLDINEHQS